MGLPHFLTWGPMLGNAVGANGKSLSECLPIVGEVVDTVEALATTCILFLLSKLGLNAID